jgi:hypothetical protein
MTIIKPDGTLDRGTEPTLRKQASWFAWWGIALVVPGALAQLFATWLS